MNLSHRPASLLRLLPRLSSLAGLALLTASVSGCNLATIDSQSADSKTLLGLGYSGDGQAIADRFGDDFLVLSQADMGLHDSKLSSAQARDALATIDGLAVDLAGLGDDQIETWQPLFRTALDAGVPMVVENAGDPDRLARIIGIGVAADAVHVERHPDRIQVTVYGDHGDNLVESDDGTFELAPLGLDSDLAARDIGERLRSYERPTEVKASADAFYLYDVDFSTYSWNIGSTGQIATSNMDFEIQLVADQEIDRKYALISQSGGGFHPGSLLVDESRKRGYFTESVKIWIDSQTSALSLHAHAPETSTSSSTYSSSTGWTAGVSGGDVASLSYSSESVQSTTINDFKTINNTAGVDVAWVWQMSKVSGSSYSNWKDIYYHNAFQKCKMHGLEDKAKSNITPKFEAVYKASSGFNSTATFKFTTETLVRKSKAGGDIFKCKQETTAWWNTRNRTVTVNFGLVSVN